jgi:serine/threonine protein kinase/Tol biopolymer transport system component
MQQQLLEHFCETCGAANPPQAATCWHCARPLLASASSATATPDDKASSGATVIAARYQLQRPLGQGGMGIVYLALDLEQSARPVALKQIDKRGLSALQRAEIELALQREADLLARLSHPNLPALHAYWSEPDYSYLVIDFIEGETLEERQQQSGGKPLPLHLVLDWGLQLCDVLDYLHQQEPAIIYRDLKPSNIMLRRRDGCLFLIDFGIARQFKPGQMRDTVALGSPGFAAPEQYGRLQTTPRSDLYSLGALLHSLLSGLDPSQQPFHFVPLRQVNPAVPAPLEQLVSSLLALDPQERPSSAEEVKQRLLALQRPLSPEAPPPPAPQPVRAWSPPPAPSPPVIKRRRFLYLGLGLAAGATAVGGIVAASLLWSRPSRPVHLSLLASIQGNSICSLAWSPNGSRIAISEWPAERQGTVTIWEATLQRPLLTYRGHRDGVLALAWSPRGNYIASGSNDQTVQVWEAQSGQRLLTYQGHQGLVEAVAWAPDGQRIASGAADGSVQVWEAFSGQRLIMYRMPDNDVLSLAWSPDGTRIVAGSLEKGVLILQAATGETLQVLERFIPVPVLAWSPDGSRIAIGSDYGQVVICDASDGQQLLTYAGHAGPVYCLAWAPNGQWIASGGHDNVQIWEADSGRWLQSWRGGSEGVRQLAWSPDGTRLVISGTDNVQLLRVS